MKRLMVTLFILAMAVASKADAQTARLQVIHNAADPGAAIVDIYVNNTLLLDDFAFRGATPFIDVPAEVQLNIGVAPGNSSSFEDIIALFEVTLQNGETYVLMANGVLNPMMFSPNPDSIAIAFNLFPVDNIVESAPQGMVKVIGFHGATDAPAVDIYPLYEDVAYGQFTSYAEIPADAYTLEIRPAGSPNALVAYDVDLSGLGGGSAVAFASGFLNPANNQNGEAFGLFAALPNGTVVEFPAVSTKAEDGFSGLPKDFTLNQNYPNPFNPSTMISFSLAEASNVKLTVFNMLGQEVSTLIDTRLEAGSHQVEFNGAGVPSGIYFYRIDAGSYSQTQKMTLLK